MAVWAGGTAHEARADANDGKPEQASPPRSDEPRRWFTITINPLAVAAARYGGNIEFVPLRHHAFIASGYLQTFPVALIRDITARPELADNTPTAFGGELGYRYYTGRSGADGFFIGPSFVMMPLAYLRLQPNALSRVATQRSVEGIERALEGSVEAVPYQTFGAALDIGGQLVTSSGFTIGGGIGITYLSYTLPSDADRLPLDFTPHIVPRVLFSTGWSF